MKPNINQLEAAAVPNAEFVPQKMSNPACEDLIGKVANWVAV
jgi:hypothetical protein